MFREDLCHSYCSFVLNIGILIRHQYPIAQVCVKSKTHSCSLYMYTCINIYICKCSFSGVIELLDQTKFEFFENLNEHIFI